MDIILESRPQDTVVPVDAPSKFSLPRGTAQIQLEHFPGTAALRDKLQHNEKPGSELLQPDLVINSTHTSKYNWTYKFV